MAFHDSAFCCVRPQPNEVTFTSAAQGVVRTRTRKKEHCSAAHMYGTEQFQGSIGSFVVDFAKLQETFDTSPF